MSDDLEGADIWGDAGDAANGGGADNNNNDKDKAASNNNASSSSAAAGAEESKSDDPAEEEDDMMIDDETAAMSIAELRQRIQLIDNEVRIFRSDIQRIQHESRAQRERIRENIEKVKLNKQLPYLVGNVVEILEPDAEDGLDAEEGGRTELRRMSMPIGRRGVRSFELRLGRRFICPCLDWSIRRNLDRVIWWGPIRIHI